MLAATGSERLQAGRQHSRLAIDLQLLEAGCRTAPHADERGRNAERPGQKHTGRAVGTAMLRGLADGDMEAGSVGTRLHTAQSWPARFWLNLHCNADAVVLKLPTSAQSTSPRQFPNAMAS